MICAIRGFLQLETTDTCIISYSQCKNGSKIAFKSIQTLKRDTRYIQIRTEETNYHEWITQETIIYNSHPLSLRFLHYANKSREVRATDRQPSRRRAYKSRKEINWKLTIANYSEGLVAFCEVIMRRYAAIRSSHTTRMIMRWPGGKYGSTITNIKTGYQSNGNARNIQCLTK